MTLSLIIPTYDAADVISDTIAEWRDAVRPAEIVVVDGGSTDGTPDLVRDANATVTEGDKGRGRQLAKGAEESSGRWLLFMHADTRPGDASDNDVGAAVDAHMAAADGSAYAAWFRLAFDVPAAAHIARLANWRARTLGLPYGDQGLLISRALYDAVGGYAPLPIMEDVDLVRRLAPGRLRALDAGVVTSARRYRRDGYWLRPARNLGLLALYYAGVAPDRLAGWYGNGV